jgi:UDP-GlcNAc:undecaprenyl-phosphate GlcNAc-1-phosphate transferase
MERFMGADRILLHVLIVFAVPLLLSLVLTPIIRKIALRVQVPKLKERFVPELGGISIYLSFMAGLLIAVSLAPDLFRPLQERMLGMVIGGTVVLLIGIYDDVRGTNCLQKFLGQTVAALIAVFLGFKISVVTNPFGEPVALGSLATPITLLWIIGISNAVNLIDGLDGLAAGVSSVTALTLFVIAVYTGNLPTVFLAVILVGSVLGFLRYNFNPARIFMGDTGSLFLGFLLALISIQGFSQTTAAVAILIPMIALGVPIVDTLYAIARRARKGVNPLKGDKEHIHHRLIMLGLSQRQAVVLICGISVVFGVIAFLLTATSDNFTALLLLAVGTIVFVGVKKLGKIDFTTAHSQDRVSDEGAGVEQGNGEIAEEEEEVSLERF